MDEHEMTFWSYTQKNHKLGEQMFCYEGTSLHIVF